MSGRQDKFIIRLAVQQNVFLKLCSEKISGKQDEFIIRLPTLKKTKRILKLHNETISGKQDKFIIRLPTLKKTKRILKAAQCGLFLNGVKTSLDIRHNNYTQF